MAANSRRIVVPSLENSNAVLPGKSALGTNKGVVRRPALVDLSTNLNKKPTDTKIISKNNADPIKSKIRTTASSTVILKETKSVNLKVNIAKTKDVPKDHESVENATNNKREMVQQTAKEQTKIFSFSSQRIALLDEDASDDPQLVAEYAGDIFEYLRSLEIKYPIDELFLACHRTTTRMRCILVNWLVDVHETFHLMTETLHLCVAILDRFLQKNKTINKENLQLVGITALWIASKYEEIDVPCKDDFVYMCDSTATSNDFNHMELMIMKSLNYSFGRPLSLHFLRRYSKIGKVTPQQHLLGKYFLELTLQHYELCPFRPSLQAAAATYIARSLLNNESDHEVVWTPVLQQVSTYKFRDFEHIVRNLAKAIIKITDSKYQAVWKKYSSSKYKSISLIPELKGRIINKLAK